MGYKLKYDRKVINVNDKQKIVNNEVKIKIDFIYDYLLEKQRRKEKYKKLLMNTAFNLDQYAAFLVGILGYFNDKSLTTLLAAILFTFIIFIVKYKSNKPFH